MFARLSGMSVTLLLLLALFPITGAPGRAAPALLDAPDIGPVTTMALDASGNGWAWATAAPQKPATRYLLRITDGTWTVAADSTSDPDLLPFGVTIQRLALSADGTDGWAIGNAGESTPIFWRYSGASWKTVAIALPEGATQPHSLTLSADGKSGWMTIYAPDADAYALLTLRDGLWTSVPQPDGNSIALVALSPDGASGWALGKPSTATSLTVYALADDHWNPLGTAIDATQATDLAADNTGKAWALVDGKRLVRLLPNSPPAVAYTAVSDVTLNALALDNLSRGWVVGWQDKGQVTQPGNIQYLRAPILVRLAGDSATPVDPKTTAFAQSGVGVDAVALTPDGGQAWAGTRNLDSVGSLTTFHEPFSYTSDLPSPFPVETPPLPPPMPGSGLCFAEVAYCLRGQFLTFWQQHGSIDQLGLPITTEMSEDIGGTTYLVQYTERTRLEYHPENKGTPGEVLLGLLGNAVADSRQSEAGFLPLAPSGVPTTTTYFTQTGHTLAPPFLAYWNANTGLSVFGYPRSEQFNEQNQADGKTYLVQYFERNRIEYHPENQGTKYEFQLGLLGVEYFTARYSVTP
jgi:hypothetical protein